MCVFCFTYNEIVTFPWEKHGDSPKLVVDFPLERNTFRKKNRGHHQGFRRNKLQQQRQTLKIVKDFACEAKFLHFSLFIIFRHFSVFDSFFQFFLSFFLFFFFSFFQSKERLLWVIVCCCCGVLWGVGGVGSGTGRASARTVGDPVQREVVVCCCGVVVGRCDVFRCAVVCFGRGCCGCCGGCGCFGCFGCFGCCGRCGVVGLWVVVVVVVVVVLVVVFEVFFVVVYVRR